jgi:hypothetical protein
MIEAPTRLLGADARSMPDIPEVVKASWFDIGLPIAIFDAKRRISHKINCSFCIGTGRYLIEMQGRENNILDLLRAFELKWYKGSDGDSPTSEPFVRSA